MTFTYVYDRMSSLRVACIAVVLLAMTRGSNASCSSIHNDINSTQVATMCSDSVVTGSSVFIDTSHARNMSLTPGSICACHAQLGEGTFNVSANVTDNTDSSSCGTYLQFRTDVFSSNISCATNTFQKITNMTVEYHIVSESINGGYCVQLEQDICADDGFQCTDGTCIPGGNRCDNFPHCTDGSDEKNCSTGIDCIEGQIPCDDHQTCISVDEICDGTKHCPDGSDELLTKCRNDTVTNETSSAPEKSYITIRCLKLPASQVSTTTPAATELPTTGVFKTTTPHTDSTSTGTDPPDTSNDNIGLILGIVFGILGGVVVVIGVAVYCWRNYANVKKYALSKIHKRVLGHTGKGSQKVPSAQPGQDNVNTRVSMSDIQDNHD